MMRSVTVVRAVSALRARLGEWLAITPNARPAFAMLVVGVALLVVATVLALVAL